jgi:hypothetical protein
MPLHCFQGQVLRTFQIPQNFHKGPKTEYKNKKQIETKIAVVYNSLKHSYVPKHKASKMMDDANQTTEYTKNLTNTGNIPEKSTKIRSACPSVYQLPSQHFQTDFRTKDAPK